VDPAVPGRPRATRRSGLRDYNLTLAHDRPRLKTEPCKLLFFDSLAVTDARSAALREAVLCLHQATPADGELLLTRHASGLASFITAQRPLAGLPHWRVAPLG